MPSLRQQGGPAARELACRQLATIYINGHVSKVEGVPISGLAVTLDEAAADFKLSYERMREKAGCLSRSGEHCFAGTSEPCSAL